MNTANSSSSADRAERPESRNARRLKARNARRLKARNARRDQAPTEASHSTPTVEDAIARNVREPQMEGVEYHSFPPQWGVFSSYIKHYMTLKISYSGTSAWKGFKGGIDAFIKHNLDVYDIVLDRELLLLPKNPAMVTVAKLMLDQLPSLVY